MKQKKKKAAIALTAVFGVNAITNPAAAMIYAQDETKVGQQDTAIADNSHTNTEVMTVNTNAETTEGIKIDENTFPDQGFRDFLLKTYRNGYLRDSDIELMDKLNICYNNEIKSLKGIEVFKNLKSFEYHDGVIESIDLSGLTKLESVVINQYQTKSLTNLILGSNENLKKISLAHTNIQNIDVTQLPNLTNLKIVETPIQNIDLSKNTNLEELAITGSKILTVDLSHNTKLNKNYNENTYHINADENDYINVKNIDPNFDITKVSNLKNATIEGDLLKYNSNKNLPDLNSPQIINFTYNTGNDQWPLEVTLYVFYQNKWLEELSIENSTVGSKFNEPTAKSKYGEVRYTYSQFKEDNPGNYRSGIPTTQGIWYVKAEVKENVFFTGLSEIKQFRIYPKRDSGTADILIDKKEWVYGKAPEKYITILSEHYEVEKAKIEFINEDTKQTTTAKVNKDQKDGRYGYVTLPSDAGHYKITATFPTNELYDEKPVTKEFTITKAMNEGEINISDWAYNEKPNTPTVKADYNPGNLKFSYSLEGKDEFSETVPTVPGNYQVKVTIPGGNNYEDLILTKSFKITKAKGEASVDLTGWTYGESENKPVIRSKTNGTEGVKYYYKLKESDSSYTEAIPKDAGTYIVKAVFPENEKYMETIATCEFKIEKAQGKGQVSLESWTYNTTAKEPKVSFSSDSKAAIKYFYKVKGAADSTYSTKVPKNAGDYTVKAEVGETINYLGFITTSDFKITKAQGSAEITQEGWTYGEAVKKPLVSTKTNDVNRVTYLYKVKGADDNTYKKDVPFNAGNYTVKAVFDAMQNYTEASAIADFTIAKAEGTASVKLEDWPYDEKANEPQPESKTNGIKHVTYYYKGVDDNEFTTVKPTTVGTYVIKAVFAETENYLETSAQSTFKITKSRGDASVALDGWTFGEEATKPIVKSNSNGVDHVTFFYKEKGADDDAYTKDVPTNAGDYVVKAVFAETENYMEMNATCEFTIHKAQGSAEISQEGWTYGEDKKNLTVLSTTNKKENVTYFYKVKGADDKTYSTDVPTNAGEYTVKAVFDAVQNYNETSAIADFTIAKAEGKGSVSLDNWKFKETPKNPVAVSETNGIDHISYEYRVKGADEYQTKVPTEPGTYEVKATFAGNQNYKQTEAVSEFTIEKAIGTVNVSLDDWAYGQKANQPVIKSDSNDTTKTVIYYKAEDQKDDAFSTECPTEVGTYVVKAVIEGNEYYTEAIGYNQFTIVKATGNASVQLDGWTYGEEAKKPSISTETNDVNKVTYFYKVKGADDKTYSTDVPTNAGEYTVKAVFDAVQNYNETSATADFAIEKAEGKGSVSLDNWKYKETPKNPVAVSETNGIDHVSYEYRVKGADEYQTKVPTEPGTYEVKAIFAGNQNYKQTEAVSEFTIEKAIGTVNVSLDDWAYGQKANQPVITSDSNDTTKAVIYYKAEDQKDDAFTTECPTEVGTYVVKAVIEGNEYYTEATGYNQFTIVKATGNASVQLDGWTYGEEANKPIYESTSNDKENVVILYKEKGSDDNTYSDKAPTDAGAYVVKVVFEENKNYNTVSAVCDFVIEKATPDYDIPGITLMGANPNVTLDVVDLPEGFVWMDNTQTVGESGVKTFKAKYVPKDTKNYKVIEDIDIQVKVIPYEEEKEETTEQNQSVEVTKDKIYKETIIHGSIVDKKEIVKTEDKVQTGDMTKTGLWASLCVMSMGLVAGLFKKKRKDSKETK